MKLLVAEINFLVTVQLSDIMAHWLILGVGDIVCYIGSHWEYL